MSNLLTIALFAAVFVTALFIVDALVGFWRAARGIDDSAVERRLLRPGPLQSAGGVEILRTPRSGALLSNTLGPLYAQYAKFVRQSHLGASPERVLGMMAFLAVISLIILLLVMPRQVAWTALFFAPIIGVGVVLLYVSRARTRLRTAFEEQLPDALDLIVRSLKIGHPVSSAVALIAREMPAPVGPEFGLVSEQISYGRDLPHAIADMQERIPAPDLAYFSMAVQVQLESGGNLVESLQKLANVIRDRYRMFRKVHAITAEGRFSAWALSLFPFIIAGAVMLVRPNYYDQVSGLPWFPYAAVAVVVLLVVNIFMMRLLTAIKV
jgi:tight adherence protein B